MENKSAFLAAAFLGLALASSEVSATKSEAKAPSAPAPAEEKVQCDGGNSCKGTSACHTKSNTCAGTNSCKGKGWVKLTEKECLARKGKPVKG